MVRLFVFCLMALLSNAAMAQMTIPDDNTPSVETPSSSETVPESDAPETAEPMRPKAENLDEFFDQGQEQAEEGSSCSRPDEPIA